MRQKLIKPIVKTVKVSEESERVSQSSGGGDLPSTEASDLPPTDGVRLATLRDLINQMVTDKSYQEGNRLLHTRRLLHFYLDAGVCKIPRFARSLKSNFQT